MEWLSTLSWSAVFQIIMIDILLGGDNAVVIALACRNLPDAQRKLGIIWGTLGAIALRIVLVVFAVTLLAIPFLKVVGGLLLLWIGVKLLLPEDADAHDKIASPANLMSAIKTIIVADLVMSLDNVLAIAGAAQKADPSHQFGLIVFGLLVSIPLIAWGSQLVLKLIDRYPVVILFGGALLGWIAGGMMLSDPAVLNRVGELPKSTVVIAEIIGALLVVGVGKWLARRRPAQSPSA